MHFNLVDAYQPGASRIHAMDSRLKLITAVALIIFIGLTPTGEFRIYLGFFMLVMGGVLLARLDPALVVRRSLIALPFAVAAISLIFTVPGPTLTVLPITGWTITSTGLIRFASIMIKSMISVQVAVILILTTHLTDMLWALSALHTPHVLVAIISFMYRYVFLLAEEGVRLTRARDSRSAVLEGNPSMGGSILFRARTTGGMIGNLLLRSFERSERIYQAMVARGYQGEMRQLSPPPIKRQDVLLMVITIGLGMILLILSLVA